MNATMKHPLTELLARQGQVLKAAWQSRHELAGPKRLADEAAFLPAALSLQATPVHPAPRRAMAAIMALFAIALGWACLGEVDIVAVAPGRIVVSERTKIVQPLEAAVVKAVHVHDGDRVQAGQVLVELDPTGASADKASVQEQLKAAGSEAVRAKALLLALLTLTRPVLPPLARAGENRPEGSQTSQASTQTLLQSEWQEITAKLAKLEAEQQRRQAEAATNRQLLKKLETTVPLARQREADVKALADQGFMSSHAGQDRLRERVELEADLGTQQARVREAQAALEEGRNAKAAYLAETERTLNDRLAQATLKQAQLEQESTKTDHREQLTRLTAPVAGTVQQLAIHTAGGVVTPAQHLMVVVPDEAEVTAEVVIDNKDIGFVRAGQRAEVKLETFNFTRYGTVPATVKQVTADAVNDEKKGAIFPATLQLSRAAIDVDGKAIRLSPGMNVTAEVKTGRRRVIEYLLSPVQATVSQSLGER